MKIPTKAFKIYKLMSKGPDIINDDNAYKEYLRIKEDSEKNKKIRIDKVLDEYCYT